MPSEIHFIYDGDCPICNYAAHAFRIKETVGELNLINARKEADHPLVRQVNERGLDLDEGMVLIYEDSFYHGRDALHVMAMIGSEHNWYNRLNAVLFKAKPMARVCYPVMRGLRNILIRLKGVPKINNLG